MYHTQKETEAGGERAGERNAREGEK